MSRDAASAVHLDTSFLIRALVPGSEESAELRGWLEDRRPIAISAYAWGEFLCGPLDGEPLDQAVVRIAHRIAPKHVPVTTDEAAEAARLFNHGGRRRGSLPDCIIAATAIVARAELGTSNRVDFERFLEAGLELAR